MMKPGVVVLHARGRGILESMRTVIANGFDNCQLVSWDNSLWTDSEAETITNAIRETGVTITAFWCGWRGPAIWNFYEGQETLGLVPLTYRAGRIEDLCNGADFAKKLGVADVITHVGFLPENPSDGAYPGIISAMRTVARHYLRNDQRFLLETGQETPVALLRAIQEVGTGNVYINLDPANLIMYGKGNPLDALDVFGPYVKGVHAKDGVYPTDGKELGHETALGQGKANFPALVKKLHELGYDGSLTIEREIEGDEQTRDILMARDLLQSYINAL